METTLPQTNALEFPLSKSKLKISAFHRNFGRVWMTVLLGLVDILCLLVAGILAVGLRALIGGDDQYFAHYAQIVPLVSLFIAAYALSGLYPAAGMNPVDEIRRLSMATSVVFLALATLTFWSQTSLKYSRLIYSFFWLIALLVVPLGRGLIRRMAILLRIWGEPVAIIGYKKQAKEILRYLLVNPHLGLLPVLVVNGFSDEDQSEDTCPVPLLKIQNIDQDRAILEKLGIRTAILTPYEIPAEYRHQFLDEQRFGLRRLICISGLSSAMGTVAVTPLDLHGLLGLEVERKLLNPREQLLKHCLDLSLVILGGLVAAPVIGICALLIKLDSPGRIFYGHKRIGRNGQEIKVWKFRTMEMDADRKLEQCLAGNPEMLAEWEATHKLKDDPRVTRVGKLLRKTSLDELPQLWNVLKGEMSLIGPRPIVQDEIKFYQDAMRLYEQVDPGVTGLWQVSGRNDVSYDDRVQLDEYYIRHWSIWMDIYILARTVWVVLKRAGAY